MTSTDHLRAPSTFDPSAAAYKDWLNVNLFDHASARVGLVNASLHGPPWDPRSRAVGCALLHDPEAGWLGNVEVRSAAEVEPFPDTLALSRVAVHGDGNGPVLASVRMRDDGFTLDLQGRPVGPPTDVPGPVLTRAGWIGWYVRPRLRLSGSMECAGASSDLARTSGYFDHNWGRWHWGDDLGWDWAALLCEGDGPVLVVSRLTDRAHRSLAPPTLELRLAGLRRRFAGDTVTMEASGVLDASLRRLPGALAALHADRAAPRLPGRLSVRARSGRDHLEATFVARAAAQLVLGDPSRRGFGFLHELVGTFEVSGTVGRREFSGSGLGVVERAE